MGGHCRRWIDSKWNGRRYHGCGAWAISALLASGSESNVFIQMFSFRYLSSYHLKKEYQLPEFERIIVGGNPIQNQVIASIKKKKEKCFFFSFHVETSLEYTLEINIAIIEFPSLSCRNGASHFPFLSRSKISKKNNLTYMVLRTLAPTNSRNEIEIIQKFIGELNSENMCLVSVVGCGPTLSFEMREGQP